MVSRSSSASRAATKEENGLMRRKVTMEISMKLPTGQKVHVVYRVGVNTEMKKVVDKVRGIFSVIMKASHILNNTCILLNN